MTVKRIDLLNGLCELGLHAGMGVMAHSSLKSFGHLAGGLITFIEVLQEIITPEGTILMPSFNHGSPFREDGPGYYDPTETPTFREDGPGYYDPTETPTSNGAIPDAFWRMPGVYRSLNPTHPFAVWGKHAERYTEFHHQTLTMGPESPLGLLQADGGYGLLVGVNYRTNTFHHVVETTVGARCLGRRIEASPVRLADGRMVTGRSWGWRADHCPITDGKKYGALMEAQGLQRSVMIGQSTCTLFQLNDCFELLRDMLTNGFQGFPSCKSCLIRPRQGPHTVESDWDDKAGCLRPDSSAWEY